MDTAIIGNGKADSGLYEREKCYLLRCDVVQTGRSSPTFGETDWLHCQGRKISHTSNRHKAENSPCARIRMKFSLMWVSPCFFLFCFIGLTIRPWKRGQYFPRNVCERRLSSVTTLLFLQLCELITNNMKKIYMHSLWEQMAECEITSYQTKTAYSFQSPLNEYKQYQYIYIYISSTLK